MSGGCSRMQIGDFWIDIEDSAGVKQGSGPLRAAWYEVERSLSRTGFFDFEVSPADPNIAALQVKRIAVCRYVDADGTEQVFGAGIVEEIDTRVDEEGLVRVIVSGPDISRELTHRSVRDLQVGDSSGGDTDGPEQVIAFSPAGWSVDSGATDAEVYVRFDGQTVLAALVSLGEGIGEHWRLGAGREIEWLQGMDAFAPSGVRAVDHLPNPDAALGVPEVALVETVREIKESIDIVTRIYPRGAGNGSAIMRLESFVGSVPAGYTVNIAEGYIEDDAAVAAYGIIEREIDFKDISPIS